MKKQILAAALLTALVPIAKAQVVTIASWDFEQEPVASMPSTTAAGIGPIAASIGSGQATGLHASATSAYSSPAGNGSANSLSANGWAVGDFYQFQVSTLGHQDVQVSFSQTSSSTGPRDFQFQYSTDGTVFTSFMDYSVLANSASTVDPVRSAWSSALNQPIYSFGADLSAVSGVDNQATVFFRLTDNGVTSANGGTVAGTGTDRVDNFLVNATPVPEPHHFALIAGFGLVGFAALRRRLAAT